MRMAALIKDRFYQLIVYGIGIMYIFQIFLTIGGGIKLIPLTGVTLPLVSYGGSSVLTTLVMFAIVEGLCMVRKDEETEERRTGKMRKGKRERKKKAEGAGKTGGMEER